MLYNKRRILYRYVEKDISKISWANDIWLDSLLRLFMETDSENYEEALQSYAATNKYSNN